MNRSNRTRQSAVELWEPILAIEAEAMASRIMAPVHESFEAAVPKPKKPSRRRRNRSKAKEGKGEAIDDDDSARSSPAHITHVLNANARAFVPTAVKAELESGLGLPTSNTAANLSGGSNEMSCAQLAWQFMKHQSMRRSLQRPTGNGSVDLSRGSNEMDCAQLAWQFMKHQSVRSLRPAQKTTAVDHSRGSNEMDCAQMAWAFMKQKASGQSQQQGCAPTGGGAPTGCAQLAWQFMKPHASGRPQPSPVIGTQSGVSGMPAVDLTAATAEDEASSDATRLGTPFVAATSPEPGMPRMKLV